MASTYVVRVNYSFTKLNGQPFFGTYQAAYKYISDSIDGDFPNAYGQVQGSIYLAPAFFPPAPDNLGQILNYTGAALRVQGGVVVSLGAGSDSGPLSFNLTLAGFNFAYSGAGGVESPTGQGCVSCEAPVKL